MDRVIPRHRAVRCHADETIHLVDRVIPRQGASGGAVAGYAGGVQGRGGIAAAGGAGVGVEAGDFGVGQGFGLGCQVMRRGEME